MFWESLLQSTLLETAGGTTRLTTKAWEFLESPAEVRNLKRGFIAMSFAEEYEDAFTHGIYPALDSLEIKAIRVDREEFNEKICDRIVNDIGDCGFLVAEVSGHRQGVYFEAGLAMGQGKPVIFCCRTDQLGDAHFDTRQYPHIVWSTPAELQDRLRDRVLATILVKRA